MRKVVIDTIPHNEQRYDTCGDYFTDENGIEQIRISILDNWRHGFLIAIHELVEDGLTKHKGIAEKEIMRFDLEFEYSKEHGERGSNDEPGDDPKSPYHREHIIATLIEKIIALELGVEWVEYEKAVNNLSLAKPARAICQRVKMEGL